MRASDLEDEVDALFSLPLAEFTGARNALAAKLKKSGREDEKAEAARVKALAKPSVSAWAVNQLYWNHRKAFDKLIASAERFHKAQKSGKVADMRESIDARREALTDLSERATSVLQGAGHSATPDTLHRITTTLEGVSAYASQQDGPRLGRLTHDVDPPGFESLGSFGASGVQGITAVAGGSKGGRKHPPSIAGGTDLTTSTRSKAAPADRSRQLEAERKAKRAAAKVSLQEARRSLTEARAEAQSLEAAQKKADAEAKKAEKQRIDAEEKLEKAEAASKDAARRARSAAVEAKDAASALEDAELTVKEASEELESLRGQ